MWPSPIDATGEVKALTLEDITLDVFDCEPNIVSGTAPDAVDGRQVFVFAGTGPESCGFDVAVAGGT